MRRIVTIATLALIATGYRAVHGEPRDFTSEARDVAAVAACSGTPAATYDGKVVAAHCRELAKSVASWRKNWHAKAAPFFAEQVVKPPTTVIYPFGGGDAITMLAVYPDATEYTSLSLEGIGDPRPLAKLDRNKLAGNLTKLRTMLAANLGWAWNTTNQLSIDSSETGSGIPGILAIVLVALDAHGYELVEARYFELANDGTVNYLTAEQLAAADTAKATAKQAPKRTHDVQRGTFNNIEIAFRKKGDSAAPRKVFRHIAADLSDGALVHDGGALAYIDKRAGCAALTKAASYLLWKPEFSKVRDALIRNIKIMVSDDTGIPPRFAKPAGLAQRVWGGYRGTFFKWADQVTAKEMIELWRSSLGPLPFRFGYYDNQRTPHLMITAR